MDQRILNKAWLPVLILYAAVGFLIYSNVLAEGIFVYDDFEYIVDNPLLQDLCYYKDLAGLRPVGYLSFAFNHALSGFRPYGYHLFNIIIHISNALLVFLFVSLTLKILRQGEAGQLPWDSLAAFSSGLIFLVHPVETQAVSYVTQRFTSLAAFFYLAAVVSYLGARWRIERSPGLFISYLLYGLSVLSCILAMKTKEISFTAPFMLLAFEYLLFTGSIFSGRRYFFLIPFVATLVIIPLSLLGPEFWLTGYGRGVDEITRRDKLFDLYRRSTGEYLLTQFRVIVIYLRLLLLPIQQQAVYALRASHSLFEPKVLASLTLLLSLAGAAVVNWRRSFRADPVHAPAYRLISIGILWFFVTLSVESSIIPIKDVIFEHRIYLPSAGFIAAFSMLFVLAIQRAGQIEKSRIVAVVALLALIVPLSLATYTRNKVWTDEVIFWDDIVKKTGKAIGYNNRGNAYVQKGQLDLALKDLDKTISFFPDVTDKMAWENSDFSRRNIMKTYMTRGSIYAKLGDKERAQADFDMAKRVGEEGMKQRHE
ncbi:MAG: tetratricopeptide repeat protein [Thermodesulfovibrionales bacterium]